MGDNQHPSSSDLPNNVSEKLKEPKYNNDQNYWQVYVPRNSNCLFLSIVLSYLIPVKNDYHSFKYRFAILFGNVAVTEKVTDMVRRYNPFSDVEIYYDETLRNLVQQFRERVVEYMNSNRASFELGDNPECYLSNMKYPNTWSSCNEIRAISGVLGCKIRLFSNNGQYDDFSMKNYRNDKLPDLELFHDIPSVGQSGDGIYYSFNLEKHVGDKYKQIFKVYKLLKVFVTTFIEHFEKKLIVYSDEVGLEGKTTNPGKIAKQIKSSSGLLKLIPKVGTYASSLISYPAIYIGEKYHRKKAKKIYSTVGKSRISSEELKKVLAEAASVIFQNFENQFLKVTSDEGTERAVVKLAEDAVGRFMNYIKNKGTLDQEKLEISSSFVTEGVILGSSKEGMGATLTLRVFQNLSIPKVPRSGRTVKDESNKEEWKTSDIYEKTGAVKVDDNVSIYYKKRGRNTEKYGYRLLFDWELERWEDVKGEYDVCELPHGEDYKYILNSKDIKEEVVKILDEIKKKDQNLQLDKIKEEVVKGNEEIHEIRVGQEEISNLIEELPSKIFRLTGQQLKDKGPVWFNMRDSVTSFVGRVSELERLHKILQNDGVQVVISPVTAVTGLGGIGKSELARKYAQKYIEAYDGNVLWINSETHESLRRSFKDLANELNIATRVEIDGIMQEKDVRSIVKDVYKYFGDVKCLFIFDNAEEYKDIKSFLPHSLHKNCNKPYILITSCNQEWNIGEEGKIMVIPLGVFEPEEAEQFVKLFLKLEDDSQNESIKLLTKELQYFPLALRQAVVYIEQENEKLKRRGSSKRFEISEYMKKYQEQVRELLGKGFYENSDRYTKTILTTWLATLDKVAENQDCGEKAIHILDIMSFFAPDKLMLKELFSMSETDDKWDPIELLARYSMIDLADGIASIHRLVQQVARLKLEDIKKTEEVLKEALNLISNANLSENGIVHVISVWNYATKYNELISEFYSIRKYGYSYATPLHLLAGCGNQEAVIDLLKYMETEQPNKLQEFINDKDKYNRTALYMAAENGHTGVVKLLVQGEAKLDTKCTIAYNSLSTKKASGWTSLHVAAFNGYQGITEHLINKDKMLATITDSIGRTPAVLAASGGHLNIVELLEPKDHVHLLHTMIRAARESGDLEELKSFLKGMEKGNILKNIVNLKLGEWSPLHLAAFANWIDIAEILIKNGANVKETYDSFTPLHCASSNGHLCMVKFLIEHGADPKDINDDGWTSLHAAAQNGYLNVTKYFIDDIKNDKSIAVNITDKKGDTPLHTAAFHGKLHVVKFLLKRGANINAVNIIGGTPLFSAAIHNNCDVFRLLLSKGANIIDVTDNKTLIGKLNFSVLHIAAVYDDDTIINDLTNKYVDKDIGRNVSLTPLHLAAFFGSSKAINCLLERGADTEACINLSEIINALKDAEKDNALRVSSMHEVITRLLSFSSFFTSYIKVTPVLIYDIFDSSGNDLFGKRQLGTFSKILKWIFNLDPVRKQVDGLKSYVEQRKNSGLNHPIDAAFFTGEGFGINNRDNDGSTVLHLAVKESNVQLVKYLIIEKEADCSIEDNDKKTPLDLAYEKLTKDPENDDLKEIVNILKQKIQSYETNQLPS